MQQENYATHRAVCCKKNEENTISSFISWLQQLHTSEENCISILQETQEVPTIQLPFLVFSKLFYSKNNTLYILITYIVDNNSGLT